MENYKKELKEKLESLTQERQHEIIKYLERNSIESVYAELVRTAKNRAQSTISLADRRMYGYGECYYYLDEDVKEIAEDIPEIEEEYKDLVYGYYELLTEAIEA